jgi:hypothetical protein
VTCWTGDGGGDPPPELPGWGEGLGLELAGAVRLEVVDGWLAGLEEGDDDPEPE